MFERKSHPERTLPIEGAELVEIVFQGNGKNAELRIEVAGGRIFTIPITAARTSIAVEGRANVETSAFGDTEITMRVSGPSLVLRTARVRFPGTDTEWEEDLRRYEAVPRGWTRGWAVEARLLVAND